MIERNNDTDDVKVNKQRTRTGFTTGACAAAAAKAAARCLTRGLTLTEIETTLPNKQKVTFLLKRCEQIDNMMITSIIKDAGDDPDCTHGAEITTEVILREEEGMELLNGSGVGRVTKPGLGLEVGSPAINPVPRKNITEMVLEELAYPGNKFRGARIVISVPGGEEMAKKTTNAKLGIIGGISILGTSGIVYPYSTSSWMASVVQEVSVAHAEGIRELVLTTGGKSEQFATQHFPNLPENSFIQVGDYIGTGLKAAVRNQIPLVHIVGMMGKLSKMADGQMQTHVAHSQVNLGLLAVLAKEAGASDLLVEQIRMANTARHALELAAAKSIANLPLLVCREVCRVAQRHADEKLTVCTHLFDFDGKLLAEYPTKEESRP